MRSLLTILLSCLVHSARAEPPEPPKGFKWVVNPVYTDDFDGTALNLEKWHDHHPRWRGRPPAKFMPENVSVSNGCLRLTNGMLEEPQGNFTIGGAAVVSRKTGAHFGYYECRLKASGISMSSTFWMSNSGHHYPNLGRISQELDILETVGGAKRNPDFAYRMNSNTHVWHNGTSRGRTNGNKARLPGRADEDFNVYGCWWENANTVHFYLNNEHVGTVEVDTSLIPRPFEHPMHINMVTETYDWETPPTPEEVNDKTKNTTLIDWVHVYTLEPADGSLSEHKLKTVYEEFREWKAADGKSTTTAKLVKVHPKYAEIQREDGKILRIPISRLCQADRDLLHQVQRAH